MGKDYDGMVESVSFIEFFRSILMEDEQSDIRNYARKSRGASRRDW
jgi:hypothetical protein